MGGSSPLWLGLLVMLSLLGCGLGALFQGEERTKLVIYRNPDWVQPQLQRGYLGANTETIVGVNMTACPDAPGYFYVYLGCPQYNCWVYFIDWTTTDFDNKYCTLGYQYNLPFDGRAGFFNASVSCNQTIVSHTSSLEEDFDVGVCSDASGAPLLFPPPPITTTTATATATPTGTPTVIVTPGPTQKPYVGELQGPEPENWWVWVIVGVGAAMVFGFYLALRKVKPQAENVYFIIFFASLFNVATDIAFVVELAVMLGASRLNPLDFPPDLNLEAIAVSAGVFLALPAALNVMVMFVLIIWELKNDAAFYAWFDRNHVITAAVAVVAFCNIHVLNILNSKIVSLQVFSCSWSEETSRKILIVGLVGHVLKDIPQLTLQAVVSISMRQWNTIFLLSTLGTLIGLIMGMVLLGDMIWKHFHPSLERTNSVTISEENLKE